MKKIKLLSSIIFTTLLITFCIDKVNALEIEMANEYKSISSLIISKFLSKADTRLIDLYEEQPFVLSDELFDEKGNPLPILSLDVIYEEISRYYDSNGDITQEIVKKLTAKEYKEWNKNIAMEKISAAKEKNRAVPTAVCYGINANDCWETTAKRLFIMVEPYPTSSSYPKVRVGVINQWKTMPSVRSFDVIGIQWQQNFDYTTARGYQYYKTDHNQINPLVINYPYQSTNMKIVQKEDPINHICTPNAYGISISQNIVDNITHFLENQLYVEGTIVTPNPLYSASYQHATKTTTLAESKNFTFQMNATSGYAMGGVFVWNTATIQGKYDNMQGVKA